MNHPAITENAVALVTGGSRGIGRTIAETLIAEGAHVAICGRNEETLDAAVAALGERARGTVVDVSDHDALAAWVDASADSMGGLDIVIANASALGGPPDTMARAQEYNRRSPLEFLGKAKGIPVAIDSGIHDGHNGNSVPLRHALEAFNALALANGQPAAVIRRPRGTSGFVSS